MDAPTDPALSRDLALLGRLCKLTDLTLQRGHATLGLREDVRRMGQLCIRLYDDLERHQLAAAWVGPVDTAIGEHLAGVLAEYLSPETPDTLPPDW